MNPKSFSSRSMLFCRIGELMLVIGFSLGLVFSVVAYTQAPSAQRLHPAPNTHTASLTTSVAITYDQRMDFTTLSTRTFAIHAMQSGLLTQTYGGYSSTLFLTPTRPFKPGELVQVSATTATLGLDGHRPLSPTVWQFRTEVVHGSGHFLPSGQPFAAAAWGTSLGDIDGDGDLDAYIGAYHGWWRNDGMGNFSLYQIEDLVGVLSALGDIDSDGDLDIVATGCERWGGGHGNFAFLNDGAGNFSYIDQYLGSECSYDVALGDLDGDGDLDVVFANGANEEIHWGDANTVWFNDGAGNFSWGQRLEEWNNSAGVALGDLDNDGDLDAFFANGFSWQTLYQQPSTVWFNAGAVLSETGGIFFDSGQLLGNDVSIAVALGDVDHDGDLDALVGGVDSHLWFNDGAGHFSVSEQVFSGDCVDVALGDLDGDADLDALMINWDLPSFVWSNDGTGHFTHTAQLSTTHNYAAALGDLDGDGDLDSLITDYSSQVWLNRNRVDLVIDKRIAPTATFAPGQVLTYTLIYTNLGLQLAQGILTTDRLPLSLTHVTYQSSRPITPTGNVSYTWQVGELAPGQNGIITLSAILPVPLPASVISNTAIITSTAWDSDLTNNHSVVSLTISHVPPVAYTRVLTTDETIPLHSVLDAYDANGDVLTYSLATPAAFGIVTLDDTMRGSFTYTPANRVQTYEDAFIFNVSDGLYADSATIILRIIADNEWPIAMNDVYTLSEDTPAALDVLQNDRDDDTDQRVQISEVGVPTQGSVAEVVTATGSLVLPRPVIRYTPATNFHGVETFTYTIEDDAMGAATATVTLTLTAVNDAPIAMDNILTTTMGISLTLPLLDNDFDVDGDAVLLTHWTIPHHGSLITHENLMTYIPEAKFWGTDTFTYTISDGLLTDVAMATLIVEALPGHALYLPIILR